MSLELLKDDDKYLKSPDDKILKAPDLTAADPGDYVVTADDGGAYYDPLTEEVYLVNKPA